MMLNIGMKNYALLTDKGKVKLTGNSIKSKTLQGFLVEFIDEGLQMLLKGDGKSKGKSIKKVYLGYHPEIDY